MDKIDSQEVLKLKESVADAILMRIFGGKLANIMRNCLYVQAFSIPAYSCCAAGQSLSYQLQRNCCTWM